MAITNKQMQTLIFVLCRFGARRIILFGSYAETPEKANDIDIGVEGIPLKHLLNADVAVCDVFDIPCDLISNEENPDFYRIVRNYGKILYEEK